MKRRLGWRTGGNRDGAALPQARWAFGLLLFLLVRQEALHATAGQPVIVVSYNVENFHIRPYGSRPVKSVESRSRVAEFLIAIHPDVVAFQEMGEEAALDSLQSALKEGGLNLPHREHLGGWDTNIFVAVLSRFPIVSRQPHTNDSFVLDGRRFHSSRSTIEVGLEVAPGQRWTLLTTHLKSKRPVPNADEAELREQEARLLRGHVDDLLRENPLMPLIVCGDFNDTPDSKPIRQVIGTGRHALTDTRPAEPGSSELEDGEDSKHSRRVTWTHFYGQEDTYSRIDYILISRALKRSWSPQKSHVFAHPAWGEASDHRPVVCAFEIETP
jgi:endonuclease/exonuclease/phosphatase family metal-dependent hydrolase